MELDFLTFSHDGKERKARRVNFSDYSAIRERIRRERVAALGPRTIPETTAKLIAQPIGREEQMEFMLSEEGQGLLLYRCVHEVDETFNMAEAERMVLDSDPFIVRLLEESKIISPPPQTDSSGTSS